MTNTDLSRHYLDWGRDDKLILVESHWPALCPNLPIAHCYCGPPCSPLLLWTTCLAILITHQTVTYVASAHLPSSISQALDSQEYYCLSMWHTCHVTGAIFLLDCTDLEVRIQVWVDGNELSMPSSEPWSTAHLLRTWVLGRGQVILMTQQSLADVRVT